MGETLPAVPAPAEMEGWESDDCAAYLDSLAAVTRRVRLVVGAVLWKWRSLTTDDQKFGELTEPYAAKFDVTKATLWRWRVAAEEALGLPKAIERDTSEVAREPGGHNPPDLPKRSPQSPPPARPRPIDTSSRSTHVAQRHRAEFTPPAAEQMRLWPDDPQQALPAVLDALEESIGAEATEKLVRIWLKRHAGQGTPAPTLADAPVGNLPCPHPKSREDKKPYGVWCGVCRRKIR